jgi:CRP/FNR family transcriptional regulator, cyclic AMP receptor protein
MDVSQAHIELLQRMPLFGAVRGDILEFLLARAPVVSVPRGQPFFLEGDPADSMFVLERGSVTVTKTLQGREHLLAELRAGDCFGEVALLDLQPRTASVTAIEDCVAIQLSSAVLFQLYERDLEQFTLIYMNMAKEIARRLRATDEHLFQLRAQCETFAGGDTFKCL